jgi:peptidylprolyl isomerase
MSTRIRPIILASLAALSLAGVTACGEDTQQSAVDKAAEQAAEQATNPPEVTDVEEPTLKVVKVEPGPGEGDINKKPVIPKQTGEPPKELVAQDLIVGKGKGAKEGDKVSVQYVGVLHENGKEFDSSWKRGEPFEVTLGQGAVIQGWDQGLIGIKEGGRRRLIIPADLAYGEQGSPPTIPANAALVFDIDAEKIN